MNKLFSKIAALSVGLAMAVGVGVAVNAGSSKVEEVKAADTTDTITSDLLVATSTTYKAFSGVTVNSDAVYAGESAKSSNGGVQLRTKNSREGIVSTTSGGLIKTVTVVYESGSGDIFVYGSNNPFTDASDLYGSAAALGTITPSSTSYNFTSDYDYVGIRSSSGARYLSSISFVWAEKSADDPSISIDQSSKEYKVNDNDTLTATKQNADDCTIQWSSSDSTVIEINSSTGALTAKKIGDATITASLVKDAVVVKSSAVIMTVTGSLTVAEAIELTQALPSGATTVYKVTVTGTISSVSGTGVSGSNNFVWLSNGETANGFELYFGYVNVSNWDEVAVANNDVSAYGYLMNYKGTTCEMTSPSNFQLVKSAVVKEVENFIDTYMHMDKDVEGQCIEYYGKDTETGAKAGYSKLSDSAKELFMTDDTYKAAKDRLVAWAAANGEVINGSYLITAEASMNFAVDNNSFYIIIIVVSAISVASLCILLVLKKKKRK